MAADADMGPIRTLDLLLLTLNCGKAFVDVPVFAGHLQHALADHATASANASLPDLVVFSLQEVAPLGHAFVGSCFLNQYLSRFTAALNLAAAQVDGYHFDTTTAGGVDGEDGDEGEGEGEGETSESFKGHDKHYQLVRQAHVGMVAILLFARNPLAIQDVQTAYCGFGVADMGNKGAVGLRIAYVPPGAGDGQPPSELTFVAAHLAAMEWNKKRRNANWRSIMAGLTFGNPKDVVAAAAAAAAAATTADATGAAFTSMGRGRQGRRHDEAASEPITPEEEAEADAADAAGDDAWLLLGQQQQQQRESTGVDGTADPSADRDLRRQLHALSVFKPDSLLFVAGDLNYRIGDARPPAGAVLPTAHTWRAFLDRDQLTQERRAGRTLHGLAEAPIGFPPTYKYDVVDAEALQAGAVPDNAEALTAWEEQHRPPGGSGDDGTAAVDAPVPWKYASHRWPSWCDRILYLDVPERTKALWRRQRADGGSDGSGGSGGSGGGSGGDGTPAVEVVAYQPLPLMRTTDHQAVYLRARVPLLGRFGGATGVRPEDGGELEGEGMDGTGDEGDQTETMTTTTTTVDPREHLPVPIDTHAWERRARARIHERLVGCGMLLFNTREGAAVMVTATVVVVGAYWVYAAL